MTKLEAENLTRKAMGRPKGSVNKTSATAKSMIEQAADTLGGVDRMVAWAQEAPENERVFWSQMYTKLISFSGEMKVKGNLTVLSGVPRADE